MSVVPKAMQRLRQDHANMTMLLDVLERQIATIRQGEAADFETIEGILDYFLTYPDLVHHPKEDLLFHRLRAIDSKAAGDASNLLTGHEDLGMLARRVARAAVDHLLHRSKETQVWFVSLGQDFINMNRRHMAEEEQHFFPLALRILSAADWADYDVEITSRNDPLFGGMVEKRFQTLRSLLLENESSDRPPN